MSTLQDQINELRAALPILKEKAGMGLIHFDSHQKAESLIRSHERGYTLTDKQVLFVARLLQRARRKHKKIDLSVMASGSASAPVDLEAITRHVLSQVVDKMSTVTVDQVVPRVIAAVMKQVEDKVPRRIELTFRGADGKVSKAKGPVHKVFDRLVRAANSRLPNGYVAGIFLAGEASSGKTTGSKMLAELMKLDWYFNGAISFPHEMLGFIDGAGKYHRTPFRDAYEYGGVYTFDEVDRSDPVALLAVNPHLANGVATFPDKQVKRHPDCIIIATANTWGLGADANYSGATKLDAAFLSRFPVKLGWDIDAELEAAIVVNHEWLARVRQARERARRAGLKVMIDVRVSQAGDALIASGFTLDEAAQMTYLANMKPEQRLQVEN